MSELKSFEEYEEIALQELRSLGLTENSETAPFIYLSVVVKSMFKAILSLQKEVEELKRNK